MRLTPGELVEQSTGSPSSGRRSPLNRNAPSCARIRAATWYSSCTSLPRVWVSCRLFSDPGGQGHGWRGRHADRFTTDQDGWVGSADISSRTRFATRPHPPPPVFTVPACVIGPRSLSNSLRDVWCRPGRVAAFLVRCRSAIGSTRFAGLTNGGGGAPLGLVDAGQPGPCLPDVRCKRLRNMTIGAGGWLRSSGSNPKFRMGAWCTSE